MPIPQRIKPISRSNMRDEVYDALLSWILEGVLRPGEKLLDKDIAEKMGVSRTPVREAMRRLEDKELVVSSANRWTKVTDISVEEPKMIYPIIWTLEELAIEEAFPRMNKADFEKMESANIDLKKALENADPVGASRADADFHDVFIELTDNPYLISILQDLKIRYRRVEVTYFEGSSLANDSIYEHEMILEALRSGNLEESKDKIRLNWQTSLGRLENLIETLSSKT